MSEKKKTVNKILFVTGLSLCILPCSMQTWNQYQIHQDIETMQYEIKKNDEASTILQNARIYNQKLFETSSTKGYETQLDPLHNGIMASLEIPKLKQKFPIYHGSSEEILSIGIGHIEWSSLPAGGKNTHAILAGHSGCAQNSFFSHLNELKEKDKLYIHVCNEKLVYEIDSIQVVLPDQVKGMEIKEGEDRLSLATCTPFGINTHRLIVSAIRKSRS